MRYKKNVILLIFSIVLFMLRSGIKRYALDHPEQTEKYYSRGIYPVISKILTSIANVFPFSIGEVLIVTLVLIAIVAFVKLIILLVKRKWGTALNRVLVLMLCTVLVFSFFDGVWLLNNYRPDFEDLIQLKVEKSSKADLENTFKALIEKSNALREELSENEDNIPNDLTLKEILQTAYKGYGPLSEQYEFFRADPVRVKGLLSSPFQTMSGYTGVFLFFAGEPTVNHEAPIFTLPHIASHELSHQQGFAQEEAANYIGFLACKGHPSTFFQYSGYFEAMSYVGNALYLVDQKSFYEITEQYSPKVLGDLKAVRTFWTKKQKSKPSEIVNKINDSYLKAYSQEDGIKSYGKFVDLLIADFLDDKKI